ncbi:hypothetical protein GGR50DRAFT_523702 [Xylaria sp. CBS 124048]|nr:hypothetical protein GGR50DRAFT_523702 [Xylaria sp. CBS 124048]
MFLRNMCAGNPAALAFFSALPRLLTACMCPIQETGDSSKSDPQLFFVSKQESTFAKEQVFLYDLIRGSLWSILLLAGRLAALPRRARSVTSISGQDAEVDTNTRTSLKRRLSSVMVGPQTEMLRWGPERMLGYLTGPKPSLSCTDPSKKTTGF